MRAKIRQLAIGLAIGGWVSALGCSGDSVTAPSTGSLEITTTTSGPEPDADGYTLAIDGGAEVAIALNATHREESLEPGTHSIRLAGMAANCTIEGDNPRSVSVQPGANSSVGFAITCGATSGTLGITVATSGPSPDPDGYTVTVDGAERGTVAASGGISLAGVAQGDHLVGLNGVAGNCQVQGENPRTVLVANPSAATAFEITCAAAPTNAGTLRLTTTTTGSDPDPDGYAFAVDGGSGQPIGVNATATSTNLASGSHSVRLSKLATNCTVSGANPRSVTIATGATAEVSFAVACTAASGVIEITTATTGGSPDPDGYTVAVDNAPSQAIGVNATHTVPGVRPGLHQVALSGMAQNCQLSGNNPRAVSVMATSTVPVVFSLNCATQPAASSSRIAFLNTDLYVMKADGSDLNRLTAGNEITHFDWSPDGHKIVFSSELDGDIHVMGADGAGEINLTGTPDIEEHDPDWSPDGTRIAFWVDGDIHIMNSDGSGRRKLVTGGANGWTWSPDGKRIAFLRDVASDIFAVNIDGRGETNLTNTPQDHKQTAPLWSPDGKWITYLAFPFGESWSELFAVSADGQVRRRLTNGPGGGGDHVWSPDSRRIAFDTDRDRASQHDSREIYVMNADGSGQTNLTNTPAQDQDPSESDELVTGWSPNGSMILYERMGQIWVMNADGRGQTNLNQRGNHSAWSPR